MLIYSGSKKAYDLSGCGAVGSALDWGSRGRKFKSCHSDHNVETKKMSPAKSPIISGFLLPKRRFFSVPKHRCKIAVLPLWIDLNSRKVNIRYSGR